MRTDARTRTRQATPTRTAAMNFRPEVKRPAAARPGQSPVTKRRTGRALRLSRAWLALACGLAAAVRAADPPAESPVPGITFHAETRQDPPNRLFVADIDLSNPRLRLAVAPGGPDPDGPGKWQTTLLEPTRIAAREGMSFVINGDFFTTKDGAAFGGAPYREGMWATVVGPAASHGTVWATSATPRPCLVVTKDGSAKIQPLGTPDADAREVIAGNVMLVEKGAAVTHTETVKHPRTVVGLRDESGRKLVVLVVDGRKPGIAAGMSYAELSAEMLRLGCRRALNLDGGGSSVMAVRDAAGKSFRVLNAPTDGRERPVANVLGVSVAAAAKTDR